MPLGIDNNGIEAGIIERGGAALSATIQRTGQAIQESLIQQQAFRQARDLGAQISQLDPASDKWPQQAAFLTSQYPLATASGLAKPIIEPMAKAYAGFQQAKIANIRVQGQKDLAAARGGLSPVYTTSGSGDATTPGLPEANQDPISVQMGKTGIPGVLGSSFGPAGVAADAAISGGAQPMVQDEAIAPEGSLFPDAAAGMRRRASRPFQDYINDNGKIYNDAIAAGKQPPFTRAQIATVAARQKAADDKEIAAASASPKVKNTYSDADGNLYRELADGSFVYPDGSKKMAAPAGLTRVAGAHEQERLDMTKAAAEQRTVRNEKTDLVKSAKSEYDDAVKMFKTENDLQHKLEAAAKAAITKGADAESIASNQAAVVDQQKRAQLQKDRMEKALKSYQDALKTSGKVAVISPDGKPGLIPKSQLEEALQNGYREQ